MEDQKEVTKKNRDFLLPASILIAALLVSISLVYSTGKKNGNNLTANLNGNSNKNGSATATINIKPVSGSDHTYGNTNASVKIIEFSDLECPFCKSFQLTLKHIVDSYGGGIIWIYRHYPIGQLHSKAEKEAEASECANELGGNDKFWAFIDKVFEVTPSNNGLDPALLPQIAVQVGLNETKFNACLSSGKYASFVADSIASAQAAGGNGTPYSVVVLAKPLNQNVLNLINDANAQVPSQYTPLFTIANDKTKFSINGALPESQLKPIFDALVK